MLLAVEVTNAGLLPSPISVDGVSQEESFGIPECDPHRPHPTNLRLVRSSNRHATSTHLKCWPQVLASSAGLDPAWCKEYNRPTLG